MLKVKKKARMDCHVLNSVPPDSKVPPTLFLLQ